MKKRFLVTSILMLLLTVFALSTSTYAWFSMNTKVSATGMQVVAKTDDTYLLIGTGDDDTAAEIQTANATTINLSVTDTESKVLACSPCLNSTHTGYLTTAGFNVDDEAITVAGVEVNTTATAAAVTNWFTAKAAASNASTIKAETARQLKSFSGYVIQRTLYLTVAVGSNPADTLTVTGSITQKTGGTDVTAAKVIVTTDDEGFVILDSSKNAVAQDLKGSNTAITSSTVRTVNIYIYYDGENSNVYTNNVDYLKGADIRLEFDVKAKPAA